MDTIFASTCMLYWYDSCGNSRLWCYYSGYLYSDQTTVKCSRAYPYEQVLVHKSYDISRWFCVCWSQINKGKGGKNQCSEMTKIPGILEYDTVSISKQLLTFRMSLRPLSFMNMAVKNVEPREYTSAWKLCRVIINDVFVTFMASLKLPFRSHSK